MNNNIFVKILSREEIEGWDELFSSLKMWLTDRAVEAEGMTTAQALAAWLHEGGAYALEKIAGEEVGASILGHIENALGVVFHSVENACGHACNYIGHLLGLL